MSFQVIWNWKMVARYEDDYEAEVGGWDEEDCIVKLDKLRDEHGDCVWYSGVTDEEYIDGEYIGRENFIYE